MSEIELIIENDKALMTELVDFVNNHCQGLLWCTTQGNQFLVCANTDIPTSYMTMVGQIMKNHGKSPKHVKTENETLFYTFSHE